MAQSRAAKNLLLKAYGPGRELSKLGEYKKKTEDAKKALKDKISSYNASNMGEMQKTLNATKKSGYRGAKWLR